MITEEDLLETLVSEIAYVLGDDLVAIYLYGAYADGDFTADRSNVNLLVITRSDPDEQTRARLQQAHDSSTALFPDWAELWWFGGGSDAEPGRNDEVSRFVDELSARLPTDSNQLEFA